MKHLSSIYYFTLMQRLSPKYKESLREVMQNLSSYLKEEGFEVSRSESEVHDYSVQLYEIPGVGYIYMYHRNKRQKALYYYPSFFCDIYIENSYLTNKEKKKKTIFLLSNIFECFDNFGEKNLLIDFHRDIESVSIGEKQYKLRYDFLNINELSKRYDRLDISEQLETFIRDTASLTHMSSIKYKHPDIYRTLLFFLYNIYAMQKALDASRDHESSLQALAPELRSNVQISLSEKRLKMNTQSLQEILPLYKQSFEDFMNILMCKK